MFLSVEIFGARLLINVRTHYRYISVERDGTRIRIQEYKKIKV